ncbi:paraquat-inducible protein B [Candidatus Pantoea edessiphila]|uniref:Paraquat-inducible protein B n=1 Tax=Candidatus Pantoea edessiphila TaxID=2044610 RepID=A0A2P5SYW0_9GAMM|nr:intermembrane transport protein PqiB [Candidatus Pantoea edessiphila]MBK4775337.1 intermembrane transport protein PqiB [Pantoea sp. Edef]PPI87528.1 paraquat-inducible protein B [Candidatus Pantoea edessiphila]
MEKNYKYAKLSQIKNWSPIWIFPFVTLFIATWIMVYQLIHLGPEVILVANDAQGIEEERTVIKSNHVTVGLVKKISISKDLNNIQIKVRLKSDMKYLLHEDTMFWIVKPHFKKEGINGLSNLLSGTYIELYPGNKNNAAKNYKLISDAPAVLPNAKGTRVLLESKKFETLFKGDPVFFRGYRVGTVENSMFNADSHKMIYQLFIKEPYISLINDKICFWKNSSISANLSTSSMSIEIGSLNTIFNSSVNFDTTVGCFSGKYIENKKLYYLFDDKDRMQEILFNNITNYVLLFSSSIRGLRIGAPVEFRGIRIGSVSQVPFLKAIRKQKLNYNYTIPVLIQLEPKRFLKFLGNNFNIDKYLYNNNKNNKIYAMLKTNNVLSGSTYIDLDFYNNINKNSAKTVLGYKTIPTINLNLNNIQEKLLLAIDKISKMPINDTIKESNITLKKGAETIKEFKILVQTANDILKNPIINNLPKDIHRAIDNINIIIQDLHPGSSTYNRLRSNMQMLNQVLNELNLILKNININSNALIYKSSPEQDPQPKRVQR